MNYKKILTIPARDRALAAIEVLLDGHEGEVFLGNDSSKSKLLQELAKDFASIEPAHRVPLLGTILRNALNEL